MKVACACTVLCGVCAVCVRVRLMLPLFQNLTDYIHARGLLFGVYTDVGTTTCRGGRPGRYPVPVSKAPSCATTHQSRACRVRMRAQLAVLRAGRPRVCVVGYCGWRVALLSLLITFLLMTHCTLGLARSGLREDGLVPRAQRLYRPRGSLSALRFVSQKRPLFVLLRSSLPLLILPSLSFLALHQHEPGVE
mgnify:CR=1 FL=1